MTRYQPCTTWTRDTRHLSADLAPDPAPAGRSGHTLCGRLAYDQARAARLFGLPNLDGLPWCPTCAVHAHHYAIGATA